MLGVEELIRTGVGLSQGLSLGWARGPVAPGSGHFWLGNSKSHLYSPGSSWPPPRTNVLDTTDRTFLKSCKFSPENPYCPIFRLGSVVSWTGSNFQEIAVQVGGVCSGSSPPATPGPRAVGLGSAMRRQGGGGPTGGAGPAVTCPWTCSLSIGCDAVSYATLAEGHTRTCVWF